MNTSDPSTAPDGSIPTSTESALAVTEELYERWRELGYAAIEVSAAAIVISGLSVLVGRGLVVDLMNHFGHWGWFAAGAGAVMVLDMAVTALGRLSRASWLVWLTYHPVPAWARLAAGRAL